MHLLRFLSFLLALSVCSGSLSAERIFPPPKAERGGFPKHLRNGAVGVRIGAINTGEISLDGHQFDADPSGMLGVFFDVPVFSNIMLTASADVYDIRFLGVSQLYFDGAVGVKPYFYRPNANLAFRPVLSVGLGYLAEVASIRPSTFLTLKGGMELAVFTEGRHAWVFDIGYFMAPTGGWSDHEVTLAPSLYLRAGVMY